MLQQAFSIAVKDMASNYDVKPKLYVLKILMEIGRKLAVFCITIYSCQEAVPHSSIALAVVMWEKEAGSLSDE